MLDCFLDYSVNPNLRFHSRIDKIIDDVIREKINIPHKFRMRLESRHCVESRIIYFRFRVLDKACLQCNVFLKGLSEEMKEALSDERMILRLSMRAYKVPAGHRHGRQGRVLRFSTASSVLGGRGLSRPLIKPLGI